MGRYEICEKSYPGQYLITNGWTSRTSSLLYSAECSVSVVGCMGFCGMWRLIPEELNWVREYSCWIQRYQVQNRQSPSLFLTWLSFQLKFSCSGEMINGFLVYLMVFKCTWRHVYKHLLSTCGSWQCQASTILQYCLFSLFHLESGPHKKPCSKWICCWPFFSYVTLHKFN